MGVPAIDAEAVQVAVFLCLEVPFIDSYSTNLRRHMPSSRVARQVQAAGSLKKRSALNCGKAGSPESCLMRLYLKAQTKVGEVVHGYLQALQDERGVAGLDPCQKAGPGRQAPQFTSPLIQSLSMATQALFPDELGIHLFPQTSSQALYPGSNFL